MQLLVAAALLSFAALAACADPPRPVIAGTFLAQVDVQVQGEENLNGEGIVAWDPHNNRGVENYKLRRPLRVLPWYIFQLQRNDLGQIFEIDSDDKGECRMRVVSGNLPGYWDWVAHAQYIGKDLFKNVVVDLWAFSGPGFDLEVGVKEPNYNTPIFTRNRQQGQQITNMYVSFNANRTVDSKYFDVPQECQSAVAQKPAVVASQAPPVPQRPNPAEDFITELNVEFHQGGKTYFGTGVTGFDHDADKSVSDTRLRRPLQVKPLMIYQLQRFDLGEVFELDTDSKGECRMRVVSGSLPPAWGWVANATWTGQDLFKNVIIDLWEARFGPNSIEIGVAVPNYDVPVIVRQRGPGVEIVNQFVKFQPNAPIDPKNFDIPQQCQSAAKVVAPAPVIAAPAPPTPPRPVIPNNFFSQTRVEDHSHGGGALFGEGIVAWDPAQNRSVTNYVLHQEFHITPLYVFQLQRFDLGQYFEIDSEDKGECRMRVVSGSLPDAWDWVAKAQYIGQDLFHNVQIDLWRASFGSTQLELGVAAPYYNRPVILKQRQPGGEVDTEFFNFDASPTFDSKIFDVPKECQGAK